MAEEKKPVDPNGQQQQNPDGQAGNNPDGEKTVSVAEMQRRLKAAEEKHNQELNSLKSDVQKQIDEAVAKAKMSEDELKALHDKEQQEKIKAIQQENATLKAQIEQRKMQDVAMKELEVQGVPVNETTLAFVVKGDEEATKTAASDLANILNAQKREAAKSNPPKAGGDGGGSSHGAAEDKFAKAKITNF